MSPAPAPGLPPAAAARLGTLLAPGRTVLGLAGPPGSGKSTLAAALAALAAHRGVDACILPMDGFHLADEELARLGLGDRKGAPETFDADGFVANLRRVRAADHDVLAPRFDRHLEAAIAGALRIPAAARLVVVEGNYLLLQRTGWEDVRPLLDECWLLAPDDAVRAERLVARHVAHGRSPAAAAAWVRDVDEPNARLIASASAPADLVLDPG